MPANPSQSTIWYFHQFLPMHQYIHLLPDQAEDWSRVHVWDGEKLTPAFPDGLQGHPSKEQQEFLYNKAQAGELFVFTLGDAKPMRIVGDQKYFIDTKPKAPKKPKPTPENADWETRSKYEGRQRDYMRNKRTYDASLKAQDDFGKGIITEITRVNAGRDLEREKKEAKSRFENISLEKYKQNRDRADRVITEVMGNKPVASPDVFHDGVNKGEVAAIEYETFDNQLEPNGYDLPANDKITAYDAATINFAMMGAVGDMKPYIQQNLKRGPLGAEHMAKDGFHMLLTGLFGAPRHSQTLGNCMGYAMQLGKEAIDAYLNQNDPTLLGKRLGESVQNMKLMFTGVAQKTFSQDMVAGTKFAERLLDLFDRNPAVLEATGLNEQDMEFMRGYVQMGKIYENYSSGSMKINAGIAGAQNLTIQEKAQILADIVIRRMVEKEIIQDSEAVEVSPDYLKLKSELQARDLKTLEDVNRWVAENNLDLSKIEDLNKRNEYFNLHDVNMNSALGQSQPLEHNIIKKLAQPGMLENWRQTLMKDPAILAQASKPVTAIKGSDLFASKALDAVVDRVAEHAAVTDEQTQAWFEKMKNLLTASQDPNVHKPWISADVSTDLTRLRIAVPNAQGGKDLVEVGRMLTGGLRDLENPTKQALDLMYHNAMEGNLYYYQAGQDMPQRIGAEGTEVSAQQMKEPVKPSGWQKFWNLVTGGWAYASICNPAPDRDPAAMDSILQAKEGRAAVRQSEMANHSRVRRNLANPEAREAGFIKARIDVDVENFRHLPDEKKPLRFPNHDRDTVLDKVQQEVTTAFGTPVGTALFTAYSNYVQVAMCHVEPSENLLRQAMAAMVLVEVVKEEQLANKGNTIASQLEFNYDSLLQGVMDDAVFQAFTKEPSKEMLAHFLMVDGARNMFRAMKDVAQKRGDQPEDHQDPPEMNKKVENEGIQAGGKG